MMDRRLSGTQTRSNRVSAEAAAQVKWKSHKSQHHRRAQSLGDRLLFRRRDGDEKRRRLEIYQLGRKQKFGLAGKKNEMGTLPEGIWNGCERVALDLHGSFATSIKLSHCRWKPVNHVSWSLLKANISFPLIEIRPVSAGLIFQGKMGQSGCFTELLRLSETF